MATSSRYVTVSDIQREISALPRPERPDRDHVFRSIRPFERDETAHGCERPPAWASIQGGTEARQEGRIDNRFALNDK
jgi:hypothetical protein